MWVPRKKYPGSQIMVNGEKFHFSKKPIEITKHVVWKKSGSVKKCSWSRAPTSRVLNAEWRK